MLHHKEMLPVRSIPDLAKVLTPLGLMTLLACATSLTELSDDEPYKQPSHHGAQKEEIESVKKSSDQDPRVSKFSEKKSPEKKTGKNTGGKSDPILTQVSPPIEDSQFKEADALFQQRGDSSKAWQALGLYRQFYKENPKDFETGWRVAMGCYFAGIRLTKTEDKKAKIYAEGRDAGKTAIKMAKENGAQCAACYFWTAINMALYADSTSIFKMLFSLSAIQDYLVQSIKIDRKYAFAGAYRLLGLIQNKLPGILGGSDNDSKKYFLSAIKYGPHEPLNYMFLAQLLEDEFDDRSEARKIAEEGLKVPLPGPERLESRDALKDLEEFLKKHPEDM